MTALCDALATALGCHNVGCQPDAWDRLDAGMVLSDPAFRAALTVSVAAAMADEDWSATGWSTADGWDDLADAIVAAMLGEAT